jgi:hypothetical protein
MKRSNFSFLFLLVLTACSSKSQVNSAKSQIPDATVVVGNAPPAKFYYADLQILTETSLEGECADEKKMNEDLHLDPLVSLNEKSELELAKAAQFKYFATNVNLDVIGFDSAKYSYSCLDGIVPKAIPFGFHVRRTPGQILELKFLDQTVEMKLLTTPNYSFSATEKRGDCVIKHNVNVFAEKVGYFRKAGAVEASTVPVAR